VHLLHVDLQDDAGLVQQVLVVGIDKLVVVIVPLFFVVVVLIQNDLILDWYFNCCIPDWFMLIFLGG